MSTAVSRREFLKYAGSGLAVLVVGSRLPWLMRGKGEVSAAALGAIDMHITDALKEMGTHNAINDARCYFWIYKCLTPVYPAESPGAVIMARQGDTVDISLTNDLDEPHAFYLPGNDGVVLYDSGPIAPGATVTGTITFSQSGAFMYYDNLNEPVNRVMGLYGAILVIPAAAAPGHKFTPYDSPTPAVQQLYDDFGSAHFPGLAWEEGDDTPWALDPTKVNCPPFRTYVWMSSQASPKLFAEVGDYTPGLDYPAAEFLNKFLRGPFRQNNSSISLDQSYIPQYFLMNGQSGFFSHFNPYVVMMGRVGEPVVTHILNAGLWTHSMHLHANHFWVTSINGKVNPNPPWLDVYRVDPMDRIDYTVPFMRPPDVGHPKGIGLPETPLQTANGHAVWPPIEEFELHFPPLGTMADAPSGDPLGRTKVELGQRMSPLCYPMHDHSEPSQTSQGGNYNTGLIAGIYFTGDRNTPGYMDFPMDEDFLMAFQNSRGCTYGLEMPAPVIGETH